MRQAFCVELVGATGESCCDDREKQYIDGMQIKKHIHLF